MLLNLNYENFTIRSFYFHRIMNTRETKFPVSILFKMNIHNRSYNL